MQKSLIAEFLGTGLLLATVIGSGIMGEQLAGGNVALALLGNTLPTGAILFVLITILGPVSGAHFNPAVSLAMCLTGRMAWARLAPFIIAQVTGAVVGVWLAHAMFDLSILEVSVKQRWGAGQWIAEATATLGLLLTIFGGLRFNAPAIPMLVGLYITAAYWFTSSTSFANPAVTFARAFSNTFAGIAPGSVLPFIVAQLVGMGVALALVPLVFAEEKA
ncbi:MAG: aquaporin family protein [Alphaproteobacteria bacterium]|nr:aquaporin family protein [Alphaproteobacteria bacterium]